MQNGKQEEGGEKKQNVNSLTTPAELKMGV